VVILTVIAQDVFDFLGVTNQMHKSRPYTKTDDILKLLSSAYEQAQRVLVIIRQAAQNRNLLWTWGEMLL
jgi:hypothetical protein